MRVTPAGKRLQTLCRTHRSLRAPLVHCVTIKRGFEGCQEGPHCTATHLERGAIPRPAGDGVLGRTRVHEEEKEGKVAQGLALPRCWEDVEWLVLVQRHQGKPHQKSSPWRKVDETGGVQLKADLRVKAVSKHPKYAEIKGMRLLHVSMGLQRGGSCHP